MTNSTATATPVTAPAATQGTFSKSTGITVTTKRTNGATVLAHFTEDQCDILVDAWLEQGQRDRKLTASTSDFIRQGLTKWVQSDARAEETLVHLWEGVADDAKALASIRQLFNRIGKEDFGDITNDAGLKVEDGKIVIAKKRTSKASPLLVAAKEIDKDLTDEQRSVLAKLLRDAVAAL